MQVPNLEPPLPVEADDQGGRHSWMPKMDFPRFDGTDVRIWLDKCEAFFQLYHIPENFKVTSASLYLSDKQLIGIRRSNRRVHYTHGDSFELLYCRNSMSTFIESA